ncbi:MAG: flavin reductase [Anaerocolumna sp.]|jgi:hypothetical protein|nr:flavin reductase [Anaerocolumna sp.]
MKVLLINGSPNIHGCTYTALEEVAKTLEEEQIETEIFHIGNKPIRGCFNSIKFFNLTYLEPPVSSELAGDAGYSLSVYNYPYLKSSF